MANKIKFDIFWHMHGDLTMGFMQISQDIVINEVQIKKDFFNENKTPFSELDITDLKFIKKMSEDDREKVKKFTGMILDGAIQNANLLWTSKFILNEIDVELPMAKQIKSMSNKTPIYSLATPTLKYFKKYSYDELLLLVYHFWYENDKTDISWPMIKKILIKYLPKNCFIKIQDFLNKNIYKNDDYCKNKPNNFHDEIKQYRNNFHAHITIKETPALTNKKDGVYLYPQIPNPNILLHLSNCIKNLGKILANNDELIKSMVYESLIMCPNLFFVSGGAVAGATNYDFKTRDEINFYYFIPDNWNEPFWF